MLNLKKQEKLFTRINLSLIMTLETIAYRGQVVLVFVGHHIHNSSLQFVPAIMRPLGDIILIEAPSSQMMGVT